jgi:hypothetical protein
MLLCQGKTANNLPKNDDHVVFWISSAGDVRYGLKMAPAESQDALLVTLENGETYRIGILIRQLPQEPGTALFYRCLWCGKPRRYLYRLALVGKDLVSYLGSGARPALGFDGVHRGGIGPSSRKPSCLACLAPAIRGILEPYPTRGCCRISQRLLRAQATSSRVTSCRFRPPRDWVDDPDGQEGLR